MTVFECHKCKQMWTEYDLFCLSKSVLRAALDGRGCPKCEPMLFEELRRKEKKEATA